jgi:hypothetical protein
MYGRLGGMYFLHLTEASAQRRRLAQSSHAKAGQAQSSQAGASRPAEGFAMFVRLVAVLGIAFAAVAALAIMVG